MPTIRAPELFLIGKAASALSWYRHAVVSAPSRSYDIHAFKLSSRRLFTSCFVNANVEWSGRCGSSDFSSRQHLTLAYHSRLLHTRRFPARQEHSQFLPAKPTFRAVEGLEKSHEETLCPGN